jgi:hypothetical protein
MLNHESLRHSIGVSAGESSGPDLLIPEIVSAFSDCRRVFLAFGQSSSLTDHLNRSGVEVVQGHHEQRDPRDGVRGLLESEASGCDGLYFGTPTIDGGEFVFPGEMSHEWDRESEMAYVSELCSAAVVMGVRVIVSGLGSGDVSVADRITAMGGGGIASFKDFGSFKDWVIVWRTV